jgi:hypothetical protein
MPHIQRFSHTGSTISVGSAMGAHTTVPLPPAFAAAFNRLRPILQDARYDGFGSGSLGKAQPNLADSARLHMSSILSAFEARGYTAEKISATAFRLTHSSSDGTIRERVIDLAHPRRTVSATSANGKLLFENFSDPESSAFSYVKRYDQGTGAHSVGRTVLPQTLN